MDNQTSSDDTMINNDALLFKVRNIFFKKALPIHKDFVTNVLRTAWLSKLNMSAFESQNGLRILVQIHEILNYMTNKEEEVFGFKYTISINGQDPKFLGVQEPTFEEYLAETKRLNLTFLEFCPCNTFRIDRFYVNTNPKLASKINEILSDVWKEANQHKKSPFLHKATNHSLAKNRIIGRSKLEHNFYDSNQNSISRLAVTWLVDGADPNEIFFNRPKFDKLVGRIEKLKFNLFTDVPYVKHSIDITSFNESQIDLLRRALQVAWHLANPQINENQFEINLINHDDETNEAETNETHSIVKRNLFTSETSKTFNYLVGVNDKTYDVTDVITPTPDLVKRTIRQQVADIKFADDLETNANKQDLFNDKSLTTTVISIRKKETKSFIINKFQFF